MNFSLFNKSLVVLGTTLLLAACVTTTTFNSTTILSEYNKEAFAQNKIKNVVVTNINIGPPSRNYLEKEAAMVDGRVSAYLKAGGFNVVSPREFAQRYSNAVLEYGDPVDPTTGKVNMKTFSIVMQKVRDQMREQTNIDAFVFTDLVEVDVIFDQGINRVARWDGVTRKPALQGAGQGVSADFNWAAAVAAASIQITMYDMNLEKVFMGRGGIELTDAVDTRSGTGFVRRRDILGNEDFIDEGIALALHPLIKMEGWPGTPPKE